MNNDVLSLMSHIDRWQRQTTETARETISMRRDFDP
jgi:hypothetical protein